MDKPIKLHSFKNPRFGEIEFSKNDLSPLIKEVKELKKSKKGYEKANKELVGQIEHEYILTKSFNFIENLIGPYVATYIKENDLMSQHNVFKKDCPIKLDKLWVNFQKKYEFNPPHYHRGLITFVIWLKIPYKLEEESQVHPGKNAAQSFAGAFSFIVPSILGSINIDTFLLDKSWEYKCILFPSSLIHQVYPFYSSDKTRISVSGNFCFAN